MSETDSAMTSNRILTSLLEALDRRDYVVARGIVSGLSDAATAEFSDNDRLLADILVAECSCFLGENSLEASAKCEAIADALSSTSSHWLYARACFVLAVSKLGRGCLREALDDCSKSIYAFRRANDPQGASRSLNWLGEIHMDASDFRSACRCYRSSEDLALAAGLKRSVAIARFNITKPLALMGRLREASQALLTNAAFLAKYTDRLNIIRHELFSAFVHIQLREYELARAVLAALNAKLPGLPQREQGAWCEYMGELELACGNLVEAEMHLRRGIEVGTGKSRDESVIGQSRRLLAEVRLAQNNLDETLAECERALEPILEVGERFEEGCVHRIIGEVHARRNDHAQARAAFKQSLDILRDIGAQFELAKTDLAAGESDVFSRRERLAHLAEAERMFEEVGVDYWIQRTRDQLKLVLDDRGEELARRSPRAAGSQNGYFVTADVETCQTLEMAQRYARSDIAILITGETGVGKDQLARYIHKVSPRHDRPLVAIDLSTIPESLWESELFGHRKGVFTGATGDKIGLLQSADGGTVFFNEIGNLSPALQAKLLEFLDTHQVRRIGELEPVTLDVRLIAATNLDLKEAVNRGAFRGDLYYRLAQAPLHLKPLRERRGDIIPLVRHFMVEYGVPPEEVGLIDRQLWVDRAVNGQWSGNARDLRSFVYRLIALADRPTDPEFPRWAALLVEQIDVIHEPAVIAVTRDKLVAALDKCGWNRRAAARDLGLSEASVRRLMGRYALGRDSDLEPADIARE